MIKKILKLLKILRRWDYILPLRYGVAAAVEHEIVLKNLTCNTIIDVGANRGQFAVVARQTHPDVKIISFEPLSEPCEIFRKIFEKDENVFLHSMAVGSKSGKAEINVSCKDDSSSLLPITNLQSSIYPGTEEKEIRTIQTKTLTDVIDADEIIAPALLKLDVQGYELNVLQGTEPFLSLFDYIYAECSFVELYAAQPLVKDIVDYLNQKHFQLIGIYNVFYGPSGGPIQGDFLFSRQVENHPEASVFLNRISKSNRK